MVSCLQVKDLYNFLLDIVTELLPWSSVSRHHFRSKACVNSCVMVVINACVYCITCISVYFKNLWFICNGFLQVTVIFEIIIRKCGAAAVKSIIPEKYKGFLKTVLEVLCFVLIKGPPLLTTP